MPRLRYERKRGPYYLGDLSVLIVFMRKSEKWASQSMAGAGNKEAEKAPNGHRGARP